MKNPGFDTIAVHGGYDPKEHNFCMTPPIYQTNAYDFGTTDRAAALFGLQEDGDIYSRISNPTVRIFEDRMTLLEGGAAAVAFSSGHNAIFSLVANLCESGDEIVAARKIYGGAVNMLGQTFGQFGVRTNFIDGDNLLAWEESITDRTKLFFFETVSNPGAAVAEIGPICEIAHRHGVLVVVDSTFTTPYLCRPFEFGADIVVHSATKYICGHGNAMGGIVIESGKFDYLNNPRYRQFAEPDASYHGVVFAKDFADAPFCARLRSKYLRDIGGCMAANTAYLMLLGLETLSLRMKKHCENGEIIAEYLLEHPKVKSVSYPALSGSKYQRVCKKYLPNGCGAVFTCELGGDRDQCAEFMDRLKVFANVSNVCDSRSMV
ncbi:MAG TPA: aminotransferase class I/II-fold pyridoxal phosphate-dependent enzyme, partial [Clostridiales bacterium]|nr:aminotransferase class I/II-fold pyridoxal phosphate-dependent enzyme [Clostridiales bacterium]